MNLQTNFSVGKRSGKFPVQIGIKKKKEEEERRR